MMIEEDRKKVFWLLKKYSSYTAWKALADAYSDFARAWEYAMSHAKDEDIDEFNTEATKDILDGQIAFEKGLEKLKQGDRNVFRRTSAGHLISAVQAMGFIERIMDPEEYVFDWMVNKDEVFGASQALEKDFMWAGLVFENRDTEQPAGFGEQSAFDPLFGPYNFPFVLPEVPKATGVSIRTGDEVPISGIWEPQWNISPGLFKALVGEPSSSETGCMNYFPAGTRAPQYHEMPIAPVLQGSPWDVTWRLIWEDRRYEDGTIPEEENEYLAAPGGAIISAGRLRALPTDLVPQTGLWWSPAIDAGKPCHFTQGDRFPDTATTDYGAVVWYFDPDKQKGV